MLSVFLVAIIIATITIVILFTKKSRITKWHTKYTDIKEQLIQDQTLLKQLEQEKQKLNNELEIHRTKNIQLEKNLSVLQEKQINTQSLQNQIEQYLKNLSETILQDKQKLNNEFTSTFKNLSQDILDNKSKQFQFSANKHLSDLLTPLKDKIQLFQTQVKESYDRESRERFSLKDSIKVLADIHGQLKQETRNLSMALKGDVKTQGQWGEMVLNSVLASSGLIEGEHYTTQGKNFNLKDDDGKKQKPDVIIKLPDNKHLVIDAKVSLTHYDRFINSPDDEQKQIYLSQFISSLKSHITQLSTKKYWHNDSLNTPEFVLMFFPIEPAFSLALQSEKSLFNFSWDRSIIVVSPTTLLAILKTIDSIWKREKQNRNAKEIAKHSGLLYDKFAGLGKDLSKIDTCLKEASNSCNQAVQKLNTGKGNIISKLETIKKLGAKTSKPIPNQLYSSAEPLNNQILIK